MCMPADSQRSSYAFQVFFPSYSVHEDKMVHTLGKD